MQMTSVNKLKFIVHDCASLALFLDSNSTHPDWTSIGACACKDPVPKTQHQVFTGCELNEVI